MLDHNDDSLILKQATVVMVSALGQERFIMDAIRAGVRNYLVKPFQEDKFQEMLAKL